MTRRIIDIVVNLWTPDLTANYTPRLNAFWKAILPGLERQRVQPTAR